VSAQKVASAAPAAAPAAAPVATTSTSKPAEPSNDSIFSRLAAFCAPACADSSKVFLFFFLLLHFHFYRCFRNHVYWFFVVQKPLPPHIRLMQMRAKSVGVDSIAIEDRLYYDVRVFFINCYFLVAVCLTFEWIGQISISPEIPRSSAAQSASLSVFFSRRYTIGKCLDTVCQFAKITNRNNEAGARKLVLCPPGSDIMYLHRQYFNTFFELQFKF
jgi:hypothetical protein